MHLRAQKVCWPYGNNIIAEMKGMTEPVLLNKPYLIFSPY